jgi:hypothetical protein
MKEEEGSQTIRHWHFLRIEKLCSASNFPTKIFLVTIAERFGEKEDWMSFSWQISCVCMYKPGDFLLPWPG